MARKMDEDTMKQEQKQDQQHQQHQQRQRGRERGREEQKHPNRPDASLPLNFTSARPVKFPCTNVRLVPAFKVVANDYNPNHVATPEMKSLERSILNDGLTQPIVTFYNAELDRYIIVDGFHRYTILSKWFSCEEIPVVVIDKAIGERMASTVRHNEARGNNDVEKYASMVELLEIEDLTPKEIMEQLGMEEEEFIRLMQLV